MNDVPLNRRIQLIALRPDLVRSDLVRLCRQANDAGIQSIGVAGSRIELARECLDASSVKVAALVGFPFGTSESDVKRFETESASEGGAQEIICVVNMGWLKEGQEARLVRELRDVREAAEERPVTAAVECGMLSEDDWRRAVAVALKAEVQFLATATGCSGRGIDPDEIRELREWAGPELGLTAVGGVVSEADAGQLVEAGANRVGIVGWRIESARTEIPGN